jgi:ATP-dependent helicase/nuclease subunit B
MQTFIDKTAEYLLARFPSGLDKVCIVFPNRRAGLFLKDTLSQKITSPIWLPSMLTIEDFVFRLSGFKPIDPVRLRFDLYQIFLENEKESPQPFYEFLNWADVLLKDFNDADMALAEIDKLFGYLSEARAMSLWNPDGTSLTNFQLRYLQFYSSLSLYYFQLKDRLIAKNQLYQGLAYRILAGKVQMEDFKMPWDFIVFAGFNALSKAEDQIVGNFTERGNAEMLWDADSYYLDDRNQEAGYFLRNNLSSAKTNEVKWKGNYFVDIPKTFEIIGLPQNVAQVKLCGQLLTDLIREGSNPQKTAVILNDESLLIPLLNSLPPEIKDFNVTMGFPLTSTPLYGLINHLFELNENALNYSTGFGSEIKYFHSDFLSLVEHHYFTELIASIACIETRKVFSDWISQKNKTLISYQEILDIFSRSSIKKDVIELTRVLQPWGNSVNLAIQSTTRLLQLLKEFYSGENRPVNVFQNKLELEYIFHFFSVLKNLHELIISYDYIPDIRTLKMVFYQMIRSVTLPFYGEPLKGLQIMGMLESRSLDFENVIMLSVNDDYIPSGKNDNSFIPSEIRQSFQLSSFRERNAVFAYHFYRSFQRAKRVYLLYNIEPGGLSGGDKSRFLLQLQHEIKSKSPQSRITERLIELPAVEVADDEITIAKSKYVMDRLHKLAEKGFSASSLNSYRRCSLQFYYRYIAEIADKQDIEEQMAESTLGSVVHEVLHQIYNPCKGKTISVQNLKDMLIKADTFLEVALSKHFKGGEVRFGKNLLLVKVAQSLVMNFLKKEIEILEKNENGGSGLFAIDFEKKFEKEYILSKETEVIPIKLIGYFDRIDLYDGIIRIIDYKTGRVEQRDLKFSTWEELFDDSRLDKCFQMLLYLYLYIGNYPHQTDKVQVNIISLRNLSAGPLGVNTPENGSTPQIMQKMDAVLNSLFATLFDPQKVFTKTGKTENCLYCSFKTICNR